MRTKAEILTAKREFLAAELEKVNQEILGLSVTDCNLTCDGCGTVLPTEWDFASHFLIPDERYLNLGGCPVKNSPYTRPLLPVRFVITTQIGN